jgi:putative peptidoglycan lipid II flippase
VTFYSMQDTKTPVKIAVVGMLSNIFFSLILMGPMKHSGLAFANALASGINFSLLFYFLRKKIQRVDARRIMRSFMKTALASFVMAILGWILLHGEFWQQSGNSGEKTVYMTGAVFLCSAVYLGFSYLLKNEEMSFVYHNFKKRFARKGGG